MAFDGRPGLSDFVRLETYQAGSWKNAAVGMLAYARTCDELVFMRDQFLETQALLQWRTAAGSLPPGHTACLHS